MNRRATISTLLGRAPRPQSAERFLGAGLTPFSGAWNYQNAAHLLRRTTFGASNQQVKQAVEDGIDSVIDQLLADIPMPAPPLNYYFEDDPNVLIGETWIDQPFGDDPNVNTFAYRNNSLRAWTMGGILNEGIHIREKMTLFWHNHFVVNNIFDAKYIYNYISTLRENSLGNFRELTKKITVDPAMLVYLNGNQNVRRSPNENYARELLELFTIGKGEVAGPGDYTTFTEQDVQAAAKALTGWTVRGFRGNDGEEPGAEFVPTRHDNWAKRFSARFNNASIAGNGEFEYIDLINMIFQQEEVSKFICRKLYRWFVYYKIDDSTELNVIEPLAAILRDNDFEIKPVLAALLRSEHFFEPGCIGCMIKNPLDFMFSILKQTDMPSPDNWQVEYRVWNNLFLHTYDLQMIYFDAPNVAGWIAYYQEPQYYQSWINATTLSARLKYTDAITDGYNVGLRIDGVLIGRFRVMLDALKLVDSLDNPYNVYSMIDELTQLIFPQGVTEEQRDYLKEIVIPGLPDFEWEVEYAKYRAEPDDEQLKSGVTTKLQNLFKTMLAMPEFHLG